MARILVVSVYDLEPAREAVAAGGSPDHVLFGLNHFERCGHSVRSVPAAGSGRLRKASRMIRRFPIPLGDLDQQFAVLRAAREADLIYCPTAQMVAQLLAYLRAAGALQRPMVWLVHHPLDCGRLSRPRRPVMRTLLRGVDAYPALTAPVAGDLAAIAGTSERTKALKWGPDPDWYPKATGLGRGVVAAGWYNRDFETFARAVNQTGVPAWIVCAKHHEPESPAGANTQIISASNGPALTHADLVALYAQARVLAIPLHVRWPWLLNGLTSLADALGMGKAVIVTRNPWIDIDVERLGIGIWVDPGDVYGWRNAIRYLDERPDVALEMGRRARALVDSGEYSSLSFAESLMDIFDHVGL